MFDGNNYYGRIDDDLTMRLYRLLRDAEDDEVDDSAYERYEQTHQDLLRFKPFADQKATPRHVVSAVIAAIYHRLIEAARPFRADSVENRAGYEDVFVVQAALDEVENDWRAAIGLAPVDHERA